MTLPHAAGAVLSNDNMVAWGNAQFGSEQLLPAEWRQRLLTPVVLADGRRTDYACGFVIQEYAGRHMIDHGGDINGFVTSVAYVPCAYLNAVVLSNNTGGDPGPQVLARRAVALCLGELLDERPRVELPVDVLAGYAGVYRLEGADESTRVLRFENGTITSQRSGGRRSPLLFSARDEFYIANSFTRGRVERDDAGALTGLWLFPCTGAEERWRRTDEPIPTKEAIEIKNATLLDALAGRYELFPGFVLEVRREGDALIAQATGQPPLRILPESESRWFFDEVDAVLEFHGFVDGKADSLVLHQGGRDMTAKRVE